MSAVGVVAFVVQLAGRASKPRPTAWEGWEAIPEQLAQRRFGRPRPRARTARRSILQIEMVAGTIVFVQKTRNDTEPRDKKACGQCGKGLAGENNTPVPIVEVSTGVSGPPSQKLPNQQMVEIKLQCVFA